MVSDGIFRTGEAVRWLIMAGVLCFALLVCLVVWASGQHKASVVPPPGLPNFHQVDPYLYRGGAPGRDGLQTLKRLGVRTIIDFRVNPEMVQAERRLAQSLSMNYINLPTRNVIPSGDSWKAFFDTVGGAASDPSYGKVFVHCAHGSDRTGFMIGMWRIQHDHWSWPDAACEALKYGFLVHKIGA